VAEKWDKSVHYGRAAAKKAMELGDFAVALTQLERVEDWLNKLPQKADIQNIMVDLLLEQERLCETLGDREQQEALLARALSTLHGTKDRHLMSEVYRRKAELFTLIGRFRESEEAANQSLQVSHELADLHSERNAHRSKGFLFWNQGRQEEAVSELEHALR